MALTPSLQEDFSGAIYRGRRAPANAVYDAVNALVNDEGFLFRRGGSAYKSSADSTATVEGLIDTYVAGGQRTVFWSETAADVYVLGADDSSVVTVSASDVIWRKFARGVVVGGLLWMPGSISTVPGPIAYGGSRKTANPPLFTASVSNGSTSVTGTGTSWLTTADAGMIFEGVGIPITGIRGIVKTVVSDTALELVDPWSGPSSAGVTAALPRFVQNQAIIDAAVTALPYLAAAGQRLLMAQGNRVYYTPRDNPFGGSYTTDYHQLSDSATIIGADSILSTAVIFTTAGVWAISGLTFDDIDAFGNEQHTVEQVSKDLILWGDPGIAAWSNALVVPAVEDVYLFSLGSPPVPITGSRGSEYDGGIRVLYRSYVAAGYQPGMASVHRGHYVLPILNGSTLVDVLICRLDRGFVWTTWAGHAAGAAYAQRVGASTRQPKLLGIKGKRVTNLTGCFDPGAATDADGTTSDFQITTRDYATGQSQPGFAAKVRARYELDSTNVATVAVAFSSDQDDDAFTTLTERGEQDGGTGWADSDGSRYQWAIVGKRRERIRFRLTVAGACTRFVLRSVELLTRPSGRQ